MLYQTAPVRWFLISGCLPTSDWENTARSDWDDLEDVAGETVSCSMSWFQHS